MLGRTKSHSEEGIEFEKSGRGRRVFKTEKENTKEKKGNNGRK